VSDLALSASGPTTGAVGTPLAYTFTVTNNGPSPATGVTLTQVLPAGINFVSAAASQGTAGVAAGTLTATLGNIAPGGFATVTVTVNPTAAGTLHVLGTVAGANLDPAAANDTAAANIAVAPFPEIIVVGPGSGGGPEVRALDARTGALLRSFLPFGPFWASGISVAHGDLDGDGVPEVIVGAGNGGAPRVIAFDLRTGTVVKDFFAYDPTFRDGVNVAAGDVDGKADIITGAAGAGAAHVKVFGAATGATLASFFAFSATSRDGVNVGSTDVNADGKAELVTGTGAGVQAQVKVFDSLTQKELEVLNAFDIGFIDGVQVG